MAETLWIVEPRDPLLIRDGRPFGAMPGARADSLDFPFPSTTTGAVRTRVLQASVGPAALGQAVSPAAKADLLAVNVKGPLLVELTPSPALLAPAPADCVVLGNKPDAIRLRRLQPASTTSMVSGGLGAATIVAMDNPDKGKPFKDAPRFWRWSAFEKWLNNPQDADDVTLASLGHAGPQRDERTHVRIDPQTRTAEEGKLFVTRSLEFRQPGAKVETLSQVVRLGLALATDADMAEGIGPLGGERRLARWRKADGVLPPADSGLKAKIVAQGACRVILLTPAHFAKGWLPDWLLTGMGSGVKKVMLRGAAVARAQTVSGWDLDTKSEKPSRRLAPAGSVYFLMLDGDANAIANFVDLVWMQCVSDDEQSRRDGFGLAVIGV